MGSDWARIRIRVGVRARVRVRVRFRAAWLRRAWSLERQLVNAALGALP